MAAMDMQRVNTHLAHRLPSWDRVETKADSRPHHHRLCSTDVLRSSEVMTHSNSKWQVGTRPVPGQDIQRTYRTIMDLKF